MVKADFETLKENIKKNNEYHHAALERGYRKRDGYGIAVYRGKFGEGYKLKYPTRESNCSNRYHKIEYYIYKSELPW